MTRITEICRRHERPMEGSVQAMKTGLVLEGGAMRGMYTAGVLDTFLDEGIRVDGVVGVSAGAIFGVNYVSEQRGRTLRYSQRFNGDKRYMGYGNLLKTGNIVNTEFAYGTMPRELDIFDEETYEASGMQFTAVVTNLDTGEAEYLSVGNVYEQMDTLRASGSMPFFSQPVPIGEKRYLDGGVADPIPYEKALELGYDRLIVVLTQDITYRKKAMSPLLIRTFYHKYKAFEQALIHRHTAYNESVEHLHALREEDPARFFILQPSVPIVIGRLEKDPAELQRVYDIGVSDCHAAMGELKDWLAE